MNYDNNRSFFPVVIVIAACLFVVQACESEESEQPLGKTCLTLSAGLQNAPVDDPGEAYNYKEFSDLPTPPLPPEQALERFELEEGFRIELVAHEPMLTDPVAMDIDADGRLWVIDMPSYLPEHDRSEAETIPLQQVPESRVVILEDTNGDGKMNSFRVFVEDLKMPRAIKVLNDGILVGEPPNAWFIQDTNGDGKGDSREVVYRTYGDPMVDNVQNMPNNFLWGMDNWIHSSHDNVESLRRIDGEWHTRNFKRLGQWGMNQDDWGRLYSATNTSPLQTHLVPHGYSERHPGFEVSNGINVNIARKAPMWPAHPTGVNRGYRVGQVVREDGTLKTATATTAPVIYRGDQFGEKYRGNAFTPEPAGNLIKRYILEADPAEIEAEADFAYEGREFLTSTDERFRPINMYNAPDGSIYVVDMYRGLFETALSLTDHLREYAVEQGLHKPVGEFGRIWRIVREDRDIDYETPEFSMLTPSEVVEYLQHENGQLRDQAQQVLVQCSPPEVVSRLEEMTAAGDAKADWTRLHALWTLEGFDRSVYGQGELSRTALEALNDPHPRVRASGIRILERSMDRNSSEIFPRLEELAEKEQAAYVRLQLLASLGESDTGRALRLIASLLDEHADSPYFREMALSGAYQREEQLAGILRREYNWGSERGEAHAQLLNQLSEAGEQRSGTDLSHLTQAQRERYEKGRPLYRTCMACHGKNGEGQSGVGARLSGSKWVQEDPEALVRIVLQGFSGRAEERGEEMTSVMPGHDYLSNEDLAAILTYIRNAWDNKASPIDPETVREVREETRDKSGTWSPDELRDVIK
ncbi:DUF7133 domain-containing protein [Fodinibius roseus]|nr:c-type cytochrome [Fodinibius roseus]